MLTNRLRPLLLATLPIYTLWMSFTLTVGRLVAPLEVAANVVLGLLAGAMAVFLADYTARQLYLRDGLLNVTFYALLGALFGAFALRHAPGLAIVDPLTRAVTVDYAGLLAYLGGYAGRGALLGALLWLLVGVNVGYVRGGSVGNGLAATTTLLGLFLAPVVANTVFGGGLLVVVAVGVRLTLGFVVGGLSPWWQGFCFGVLAGLLLVALPFIGVHSGAP